MVRGRVFKKDVAEYIEDAALIRYLKNQSNFHVVELADIERVRPTLPVQQAQAQPLPPAPPPPPVVVQQDAAVLRKGVLEVKPAETAQAQTTEGPEPLERTPVKPIPRTPRTAKGRRSIV